MPLNKIRYVLVGVVIAAIVVALTLSGSDLEDVVISSNPDHVISSKDCGAAALIAAKDLEGASQQLGILRLLGDCINTGEIESVPEARETMKMIVDSVEYEWPESMGNTPDNPIKFPYTLDENYMVSDTGIGGCEITINSMDITRGDFQDIVRLDMEIKPVRDIEYCQLNGMDRLLQELANTDNDRAQGSKKSIMESGDILVKIYANTNYPDSDDRSNTLFGFVRTIYEDYLSLKGLQYVGPGHPEPWWYFGEETDVETGVWSPDIKIINAERITTGYDFFAGYTFTSYARYPTSIEFVFIDASRLDEIEGDLVSFLDPRIQYSKYFEITP